MLELIKKNKSVILYLVFGVLTTIINIVVYDLCAKHFSNITSTIIAWFLTVIAAYLTNKKWVFGSDSYELSVLVPELTSFFACRFSTGILDLGIMYVAVDVMNWNGTFWKLCSNVLVVVLNYIFSKLIIFKDRKN